jgi:hypothetical protein
MQLSHRVIINSQRKVNMQFDMNGRKNDSLMNLNLECRKVLHSSKETHYLACDGEESSCEKEEELAEQRGKR